jgi:hypothetical protein
MEDLGPGLNRSGCGTSERRKADSEACERSAFDELASTNCRRAAWMLHRHRTSTSDWIEEYLLAGVLASTVEARRKARGSSEATLESAFGKRGGLA